jgi:CHAD domain-containing protein
MKKKIQTFAVPPSVSFNRIAEELKKTGYRVHKLPPSRSLFTYFDTQDGKLFKSHLRLWMHHEHGVWQLARNKNIIGSQSVEKQDLLHDGLLGRELEPVVKKRSLLPHLKAEIAETSFQIQNPVKTETLLSLQDWKFSSPYDGQWTRTFHILSISSEDTSQDASYIRTLLRDLCGIHPAVFDPLRVGTSETHSPLPGAPVPSRFSLNTNDTIYVFISKTLEKQVYKMWANIKGTILDLDPEFLHDLRVATRRSRFALKLFKPYLETHYIENTRTELSWIACLLGRVRDLDVFLPELQELFERVGGQQELHDRVSVILNKCRAEALDEVRRALESSRYSDLVQSLQSVKEAYLMHNGEIIPDAVELAPVFIRKSLKKILNHAKGPVHSFLPSELHRLRILFKGLRYTSEFVREFYGSAMNKFIKSYVAFQDCLGLYQDAHTALGILDAVYQDMCQKGEPRKEELLTFGALIQSQREKAIQHVKRFKEIWEKFPEVVEKIKLEL